MTSLDEKAQAQLVRWLIKKYPDTPKATIQVMVGSINSILLTPDTNKSSGTWKLGALKELALWLGVSYRDLKDPSMGKESNPKELKFHIPGLDTPSK